MKFKQFLKENANSTFKSQMSEVEGKYGFTPKDVNEQEGWFQFAGRGDENAILKKIESNADLSDTITKKILDDYVLIQVNDEEIGLFVVDATNYTVYLNTNIKSVIKLLED